MRVTRALGLSLFLAATFGVDAAALDGQYATVTVAAVSGYSGHAFVYAQVVDAYTTLPAPNGTLYNSPYYSRWVSFPANTPGCSYVWAVYVYDKRTGAQINPIPPGTPGTNFQTATVICPTPDSTPAGAPILNQAKARLDLDLQVSVSPVNPLAGSVSVLTARLAAAVVNDLNLYLSMAVQDWRISGWTVDFGDGMVQQLPGRVNHLQVRHVYQRPGQYQPRVVARIVGRAQAAAYDRTGNPYLITRNFEVEVGNSTSAAVLGAPIRAYIGPFAVATVSPVLHGSGILPGLMGFRQVDVFRAALTDFYLKPQILRDGFFTVNGNFGGPARSTMIAWRYTGPPSDAPAGIGTAPDSQLPADRPLRLQWNAPGKVVNARGQPFVVPVTLYFRTVYSDGHIAVNAINSSFSVTVDFAAENG
jgi:hypothetical protein